MSWRAGVFLAAMGIVLGLTLAYPWSEFSLAGRVGEAVVGRDDVFERRVREVIRRSSDEITDALQRGQGRGPQSRVSAQDEVRAVIAQRRDDILRDPASPVGGNPNGGVTIVEFFDYNCPYCRRVAPLLEDIEQADRDLRFVYKEFPILGPNSVFAARAALAAARQGKYVAYHKAMMRSPEPITADSALAITISIGLDADRLRKDMDDPAIAAAIDRNLDLAQALRINGTPGFVVGDNVFLGALPPATLQALIDRARKK